MRYTATSMKWIKLFFYSVAFFAAMLGIILIFYPTLIVTLFLNTPLTTSGTFFIRFIGTTLFGFGLLNARAATSNIDSMKIACEVNIASLAPALVISIYGAYSHIIVSHQLLFIGEHLVLLGSFVVVYTALRRSTQNTLTL